MSKKKARRKNNKKTLTASDFSSLAAYHAYVRLLQVQRGATATLYDKLEAQKMQDQLARKKRLAEVKDGLNKIASQPKYRSKNHPKRVRKYDFLAGNGSQKSVGTGHIVGSMTRGGASKIDSSHNPEDYKWSNKNALKFNESLARMRKNREIFSDDK